MKGKNYLTCRGITFKGNTREKDTTVPKKRQEGITLVALVITIIVLLILAGVTINVAIRTGLMSKSENAVDKYLDQERVEADRLDAIEKRMGELSGMKDNTEGTEHTKMIEVKPYSYKNPVIPAGFRTSSEGASWSVRNEEEVSGWNDGLVIEDTQGNQFVWVPVDNANVTYNYHYNVHSSGSADSEQSLPSGVTSEEAQITTYGGFYIGRYEAGIPSTLTTAITTADATSRNVAGTPVVKKNQVPWNFISWTQAKANAESMYNTTSLKSELITDKMWDTTLQWLEKSEINVTRDCRAWGNYFNAEVSGITEYSPFGDWGANWTNATSSTKPADKEWNDPQGSWLLKTGHTEYTKRKNIYDLAGNIWEWSNAKYSSSSSICACRGGDYGSNSAGSVAAYRSNSSDAGSYHLGFRVALFVQ